MGTELNLIVIRQCENHDFRHFPGNTFLYKNENKIKWLYEMHIPILPLQIPIIIYSILILVASWKFAEILSKHSQTKCE